MMRGCLLCLALASGPNAVAADAVCRLELQDRAGPHLTATLTKRAETAELKYEEQAGFLYPFTYDCIPPGTRICITDTSWSLHAVSFEYLPFVVTVSVLDRVAYANLETSFNLRMWRLVDCNGNLELE